MNTPTPSFPAALATENFHPLLVAIAARRFTDARLIESAVRETLRRVFDSDEHFDANCPLAVWVAGVASAVCDDLRRRAEVFREDLLAAA